MTLTPQQAIVFKRDLIIPNYVVAGLKEFGITALPEIKSLTVQYVNDSDDINIDWHYFTNWVAMGYSEH